MTDAAYVGTDFELAELINDEILKETRAALEDLLTASNLSGHAGRMIASGRRSGAARRMASSENI